MNKKVNIVIVILLFLAALAGLKFWYDSRTAKELPGINGSSIAPGTAVTGDTGNTETSFSSTTGNPVTTARGTATVPLPDITVYDGEGKPIKLSSFRGKNLVINAWASWCGPCKSEMPEFLKIDQKSGDYNVVMVNLPGGYETRESSDRFLRENQLDFRNMTYDTNNELSEAMNIDTIPTTILVDGDGNIHYYQQGTLTEAQVLDALSTME